MELYWNLPEMLSCGRGAKTPCSFPSGPDNRLLSTVCSLQIGVRATVNDINLVTEQEGTAENWDFLRSPD